MGPFRAQPFLPSVGGGTAAPTHVPAHWGAEGGVCFPVVPMPDL